MRISPFMQFYVKSYTRKIQTLNSIASSQPSTWNIKHGSADKSRTNSSEWKRKRPQVVIFFCIVNINQNWQSCISKSLVSWWVSIPFFMRIFAIKFNRKSGTDLLDITSLLMYNHVYSWIMSHHGLAVWIQDQPGNN